ncbi:hypothetical protein BDW66DRAFT_120135 [Aspergillus desertorum]
MFRGTRCMTCKAEICGCRKGEVNATWRIFKGPGTAVSGEEKHDTMIETGSPDTDGFLQSLREDAIASDSDHRALRIDLARECVNEDQVKGGIS